MLQCRLTSRRFCLSYYLLHRVHTVHAMWTDANTTQFHNRFAYLYILMLLTITLLFDAIIVNGSSKVIPHYRYLATYILILSHIRWFNYITAPRYIQTCSDGIFPMAQSNYVVDSYDSINNRCWHYQPSLKTTNQIRNEENRFRGETEQALRGIQYRNIALPTNAPYMIFLMQPEAT